MNERYRYFIGIDWARQEHTICLVDVEGRIHGEKKIEHSGAGLAKLAAELSYLSGGDPAVVAVGIETPRGAVVETLVEQGFAVFSLNPRQMDRFRDRHTMAGAKDDRLDAFVIADALRTDRPLFRRVRLDSAGILRIRELSRAEEELQRELRRSANQLQDLLHRYYPQALQLCPAADEPWFWALLRKAPLPAQGARLRRMTIDSLLRQHRIRRLGADEISEALRQPALRLAPGAAEAAAERVMLLLPIVSVLEEQHREIGKRISKVMEEMSADAEKPEHRDVVILLSLPGVGEIVGAAMLAEASQALSDRDYHALRSYAGCAPVTRQSGKSRTVSMRRGCNTRLRNAVYHWSRVSVQRDERSRTHYAALKESGRGHGRALRGVADRLLAILIAMLRSGNTYDATLRSATTPAKSNPR